MDARCRNVQDPRSVRTQINENHTTIPSQHIYFLSVAQSSNNRPKYPTLLEEDAKRFQYTWAQEQLQPGWLLNGSVKLTTRSKLVK